MSMCYNGETKECDDMQEMIKLENVTKVYKTGVRAVNEHRTHNAGMQGQDLKLHQG